MPPGGAILIMILVAVGAVVALYLGHQATRRRREELAGVAARLGFSFDPSKDRSHDERYRHFEVFRRGHSRVAHNTMTGRVEINGRDHDVVMGDFVYRVTRNSGKSSSTQTYRMSYLIVRFPYHGLPDLLIRPEGFFDKVGQALGFDDIDFEDAEFSRRFVVKSGDRRFAYDVCHPRMIEWLKSRASDAPAIDLECGQLCLARDKDRWAPSEFGAMLGYAREFIDRWPDHLVSELQGGIAVRTMDEGGARPRPWEATG